jgi:hypothetical protein
MKPHKVTDNPYMNYKGDATNPEYTGESPLQGTTYGKADSDLSTTHSQIASLNGATYEVFLPMDYLHMLNCVCIYYIAK